MKKYNLSEIMHKAWKLAALDAAATKAGKSVAKLLEGSVAV